MHDLLTTFECQNGGFSSLEYFTIWVLGDSSILKKGINIYKLYQYAYIYIYLHKYTVTQYTSLEALCNPQISFAWISGWNQAHKAVVVMPMIGLGGVCDAGMPGNWHCIWKTFQTGFVDMFLCCFGVNQKEIWWIFKQLRKEEFREESTCWENIDVFFS